MLGACFIMCAFWMGADSFAPPARPSKRANAEFILKTNDQ